MGEPIRSLYEGGEVRELPYEIEDHTLNRGVRKTKIKTEQRMWDSNVYAMEKTWELMEKIKKGELGLSAEAVMMNSSVYSEKDIIEWGKIRQAEIKKPWWEDDDFLRQERDAELMEAARPPEDRAGRYLQGSDDPT